MSHSTPRRRRASVVGALALALALTACGSSGSGTGDGSAETSDQDAVGEPVSGGTLTVALGSSTTTIDPHLTGSSITAVITRDVVDSLVGQAPDNSFTPWLAQEWEVNEDNTLYTFHLTEGVTFSDGEVLDAAAVKQNLDRVLDPDTASPYARSLLGPVTAVEAPDDLTVTIAYETPFSTLLQGLSLPYLGILSPAYLDSADDGASTIVGSGPFTLAEFTPGVGASLVKREDYDWGPGYASHTGPAYLDAIEYQILTESSVRLNALTSGQVQAIDAVPPADYETLSQTDGIEVTTYENPGVNFAYHLNSSTAPFDDVLVRQAFASAIDVAGAVNTAYFGTLAPADNILGPSTLYYDDTVQTWAYDPDEAAALLDEAGWDQIGDDGIRTNAAGERLTVEYVYGTDSQVASDVTLAQAIQSQVAEAGIDLQLVGVDDGTQQERLAAGDYDLGSFYYVRAEPDILRTVFHSANVPPNGADVSHFDVYDDELTAAVGASDAEREQIYSDVQHEVVENAYAVPLYVAAYQLGHSSSLQGISWATNAKPLFYDAWLQG